MENLRQGGKQAVQGIIILMFSFVCIIPISIEHVRDLERLIERYNQEAFEYRERNDIKKADLILHKKSLVAEEVNLIEDVFTYRLLIFSLD